MKGSIIIVLFFALGTLLHLYGLYPSYLEQLDLSFYALCALMFCVGISVGNNPQVLLNFKTINPRFFLLPVLTVLGTLVGCCVSSVFFSRHSPVDCMAVGAGFGYYSLSSIIITEYKGAELGTIALLSNIMREIIALLAAPFLVRFFGKLAPISVGGATTMDTTLPIITRCSGEKYIVVSIVHGCLLDFSVPFIVTLLCTI
nr:lysine exporter LysO family protein [Bacteroides sp.]